jgi:hypothetical protein
VTRLRRGVARALDSVGLKRPIKAGLNTILAAGGLPPVGEPRVFHDLERLLRTPRPRPDRTSGRILFFSMRGWTTHVAVETMLAEALAQRGVEPVFFTCGGPLPLCGITNFRAEDPTPCADCHGYVSRYLDLLGFPVTTLEQLVSADERAAAERRIAALPDDALQTFEHDGLPLGRAVRTSVLWFLLRGTPEATERWTATYRSFLVSASLMRVAAERLLDRTRPDRVFCLNGLFFAERVLREVATRRGIPVTTYERGFMPDSWVFFHDGIACDYPIAPAFREIADRALTPEQATRVDAYLDERTRGGVDAGQYWPRMEARRQALIEELRLDPDKPIVSAFTNITWDSAVLDHDVGFDSMFDWLERTVRCFAGRDDGQLVIRTHPAELRLPGQETAQQVPEALAERLGGIPERVRIVPAESGLSSYTLGAMSRFAIVYTSTMGLELAANGLPVVVTGDTHYRDLGFTVDVDDRETYPEILGRLLRDDPPAPDTELAKRYAHFFFFRFMIPLGVTREVEGKQVRIPLERFDELAAGRDPALDAVADGLAHGRPVFLPDTAVGSRG